MCTCHLNALHSSKLSWIEEQYYLNEYNVASGYPARIGYDVSKFVPVTGSPDNYYIATSNGIRLITPASGLSGRYIALAFEIVCDLNYYDLAFFINIIISP